MKPVIFPIRRLVVGGGHHGFVDGQAALLGLLDRLEHALVVARHDLDEAPLGLFPAHEQPRGHRALRVADVPGEEILHEEDVFGVHERLEVDHAGIAAPLEVAGRVEDVGDAARHARGEVAPAEPAKWMRIVSSGRPSGPWRRVSSEPRIVPTVRLTLRMGRRMSTGSRRSRASRHRGRSVVMSSDLSRPWSCSTTRRMATSGPTWGRYRMAEKSSPRAFQWSTAGRTSRRSERPISSSMVRTPSWAMCSRTSSATKRKKASTNSGLPVNLARSLGSWVAMPTGHVLRWQTRIMMQPRTTRGAVEKPYSSAPRRAAMTTSRPVFIWPSVWTMMRSRSLFMTRICCVSARPSSHGTPPCLMEVRGEAPVPPSCPEMRTTSAWALATPAATVPTPTSATSLTLTRALGLPFLRSWMSWARSSIE